MDESVGCLFCWLFFHVFPCRESCVGPRGAENEQALFVSGYLCKDHSSKSVACKNKHPGLKQLSV